MNMSNFTFTMALMTSMGFSSFAARDMAQDLGNQPCMQIKKACESSGLLGGKLKLKDCIKKVTSGEKVSGVNIKSEIIQNCKEKFEK